MQELHRRVWTRTTDSVLSKPTTEMEKGYGYVFAKNVVKGRRSIRHLIFSELLIDAGQPDTTADINAFVGSRRPC